MWNLLGKCFYIIFVFLLLVDMCLLIGNNKNFKFNFFEMLDYLWVIIGFSCRWLFKLK